MAIGSQFGFGGRAASAIPTLAPEEESSLIDQLLGGGASVLEFGGNVLDTPGGFVRTLLAGEDPFASILNPEKRVSGRSLLERAGLLTPNEEGLDFGDVAGFAAEIASDPLTLLLGGTTKAGKIAQAVGSYPARSMFHRLTGALERGKRLMQRQPLESVLTAERLARPGIREAAEATAARLGTSLEAELPNVMKKSFSIGNPLTDTPWVSFDLPGSGGRAALYDKIGGAARQSYLGRAAASLFDPTVAGAVDIPGQQTRQAIDDLLKEQLPALDQTAHEAYYAAQASGFGPDARGNIGERPGDTLFGPKVTTERAVEREEAKAGRTLDPDVRERLIRSEQGTDAMLEDVGNRMVETGLIPRKYENDSLGYRPREATDPNIPTQHNVKAGRSEHAARVSRETYNEAMADADFHRLAKGAQYNLLDPENLSAPAAQRADWLANLGYDVEDLQDLQADQLLQKPPTGSGPDFAGQPSRAAAPRTRTNPEGVRKLREYGQRKWFGADDKYFAKADESRKLARELKSARDDLAEVRRRIDVGETHVPLAARETKLQQELDAAIVVRDQYRGGQALRRDVDRAREEVAKWEQVVGDNGPGLSLDQERRATRKALQRAEKSAVQYRDRMTDMDIAEEFTNDEIRTFGALRHDADQVPSLRAKLKRIEDNIIAGKSRVTAAERLAEAQADLAMLEKTAADEGVELGTNISDAGVRAMAETLAEARQAASIRGKLKRVRERIANGERDINLAEELDFATEAVARREAAQAFTDADKLRNKWIDDMARSSARRDTATVAGEGARPYFADDPIVVALKVAREEMEKSESVRQAIKTAVRGMEIDAADQSIPRITMLQLAERLGTGGTVPGMSNYIKLMADLALEAGTLPAALHANIAGPRAVMTSGMKNAELITTTKRLIAEAAGVEKSVAQLADPNLGKLEYIAGKAKELAAASHAQGTLSDAARGAIEKNIDSLLSGAAMSGAVTDKGLEDIGQKILSDVVAEAPIPNDGLALLKSMTIPEELADSLAAAIKPYRQGGPKNPVLSGWDQWRTWWKKNVTLPFSAYIGRNALQMFWQHATTGSEFIRSPREAALIVMGKHVDSLADIPGYAGLTAKQATEKLRSEAAAHSTAMRGVGSEFRHELYEPGRIEDITDIGRHLPGETPLDRKYITEPLADLKTAQGYNPLSDKYVPGQVGSRVSNTVENIGRLATFIAQRRQGKTAAVAAQISDAAHAVYDRLTKFESSTLRRMIPFYSWSRNIIPYTLRDLARHPGGLTAQAIRAENKARDESGWLPPQIEGGLAIPLGKEADGTQRYIAKLELPFETLNQWGRIGTGVGDTAEKTFRSVLGQTDPLAKLFIERGMGKSAFQGRNLDDLDSPVGRIAANVTGSKDNLLEPSIIDQVVIASPASRYVSTLAQLTDTRKSNLDKALSMTAGVRLHDVDLEKARSIAASKALKEAMKDAGGRTFENVTIPPDALAQMSPAEREEATKLLALLKIQAKRSRERKKAEKAAR